jgi:hypothetical protein
MLQDTINELQKLKADVQFELELKSNDFNVLEEEITRALRRVNLITPIICLTIITVVLLLVCFLSKQCAFTAVFLPILSVMLMCPILSAICADTNDLMEGTCRCILEDERDEYDSLSDILKKLTGMIQTIDSMLNFCLKYDKLITLWNSYLQAPDESKAKELLQLFLNSRFAYSKKWIVEYETITGELAKLYFIQNIIELIPGTQLAADLKNSMVNSHVYTKFLATYNQNLTPNDIGKVLIEIVKTDVETMRELLE